MVDNVTVFDSAILPRNSRGLRAGQRVQVSGSLAAEGELVASRIGLLSGIDETLSTEAFQLFGAVQSEVSSEQTFTLQGVTIDVSQAVTVSPDPAAIEVGAYAVVKGAQYPADATFIASSVEILQNRFGADDEIQTLELEGSVDQLIDANHFSLNGQRVSVDSQTRYTNGDSADIVINGMLNIKGSLDPTNPAQISAAEVEFLSSPTTIVIGTVSQLTITQGEIPVGEFMLGNQRVISSVNTTFVDNSILALQQFKVDSIQEGDFLVVTGVQNDSDSSSDSSSESNSVLNATLIEREEVATLETVEVIGIAESVQVNSTNLYQSTFSIEDIPITLIEPTKGAEATEGTELLFQGSAIDADQFFDQLEGSVVEAEGAYDVNSGVVQATRLNIITYAFYADADALNINFGTYTVSETELYSIVNQGPSATLEIVLDSLAPSLYGRLQAGSLNLNGSLVVRAEGIALTEGSSFNIFQGTLSGSHSSITLPTLSAGLEWDTSALYTSGNIVVQAASGG